jgi:hypothetical protein
MKTKYCNKCKKVKPLSDFNKSKRNKDGYQDWCRTCQKKYYKKHSGKTNKRNRKWYKENYNGMKKQRQEYYKENRDYLTKQRRNNYLKSLYNIDLQEYNEMLEFQDNRCAICGKTPEENGKRLSVDHDHETSEIRELLCNSCNVALGYLNDDPEMCELAKLYLEKHGK